MNSNISRIKFALCSNLTYGHFFCTTPCMINPLKRFYGIANFLMGALFTLMLVSQFAFRKDGRNAAMDKQIWYNPALPAQLSFAGEKVPLDRWDVREKLDREVLFNYYNQGYILFLIKLTNRYFPVISERLKANGVPDDFKYLCIAESNIQYWAVSHSGAVGYWQFLNCTGSGYGLETDAQVDQRQDLERSTDAACIYFKQAHARFGNWTAAAASYNCGIGGYNTHAAFQRTMNYYDLQLPEETNKYIFRILAIKYLLENASDLGFVVSDEEKYQTVPCRNVTVSSTIPNLAAFAIQNGTTYKILKLMNPWIQGKSLKTINGKTYTIRLPLNKIYSKN